MKFDSIVLILLGLLLTFLLCNNIESYSLREYSSCNKHLNNE